MMRVEVDMSTLSELEMRILSELEEAGEEDVLTLIATVMKPAGAASEVAQVCEALGRLVRAGFVRMSVERDSALQLVTLDEDQSLTVISGLPANLHFEAEGGFWINIRRTGGPYQDTFPYVVGTDIGITRALEILKERGYQWWRQKA
jgi:hypothetical protein